MPKIKVEVGYHCPFCPDHRDKVFYTSALINVPICEGCREELFHFSQFSTRPNDLLIEKVEKQTGKSWSECKLILLRDSLAYWKSVASGQQPDWFRTSFDKLGWSEKKARAYVKKQIQHYQALIYEEAQNDS
jgi:hypothetical protein